MSLIVVKCFRSVKVSIEKERDSVRIVESRLMIRAWHFASAAGCWRAEAAETIAAAAAVCLPQRDARAAVMCLKHTHHFLTEYTHIFFPFLIST